MRRALWIALLALVAAASFPYQRAEAAGGTGGCVTCLGPQTEALWQEEPRLGGFTHYGKPLARHLRVEVLYVDAAGFGSWAVRWPLIKALDAFGSWQGVQPAKQQCFAGGACLIPTFDLTHATYRSREAAFVDVELAGTAGCLTRIPGEAAQLLRHEHWKLSRIGSETNPCWNAPIPPGGSTDDEAPLVLVGGYLQVGVQIVAPADFQGPLAGAPTGPPGSSTQQATGLPFAEVHDALANNQPTKDVPASTLYHVNAEANLIEAFICRADGRQPHNVCARSVITKLLKRIH